MTKTKILTLCLTLAALGLMPSARAQFTYTTNRGAITITSYTGGGGAVIIPASTNGYPVTSIGELAFNDCPGLTSVTLPHSLTTIGGAAFNDCPGLTNVTIPNSVSNIGEEAFYNCSSLTNITVIAGNPDYSSTNGVLFNQDQTTLIEFPGGLGGSYAIPNSVISIGEEAFLYCPNLTSVSPGNSVTIIGELAFYGCTNLNSITLSDSVTSIGDQAFYECHNLAHVTLPNSVTSIGTEAFFECYDLTDVTIGNNVRSIGEEAFYGCYDLTSVIIPNSATSIGEEAFYGCTSLTNITVIAGNPDYSSTNGVLFNQDQTTLIEFPGGLGGSYLIPHSVTKIREEAFEDSGSLTNVVIDTGVTSVGEYAFSDCTNLIGVTIGTGVTSIEESAFYDCPSLTNVTFLGNAPVLDDPTEFTDDGVAANAVNYYYGTTGWSSTYGGLPAVGLFMPPQISGVGGDAGVPSGNFSFTVTGVSNQTVVVEASTNLVNWQPVWTNTLSGTNVNFTDPQWKNYPSRFYRAQ